MISFGTTALSIPSLPTAVKIGIALRKLYMVGTANLRALATHAWGQRMMESFGDVWHMMQAAVNLLAYPGGIARRRFHREADMGYRSTIAYMILFPNEKEYLAFLTEAATLSNQPINNEDFTTINGSGVWGDMSSALAETKHSAKAYRQDYLTQDGARRHFPAIVFNASGVKWYPSYPDVHAHESLMFLAQLWVNGGEFSYDIGVGKDVLMTKCAMYMVRYGEDKGDEELIDVGRHTSLTATPIWVERSIDFHGSIKGFLDKEDV
jgi:hypothetical protein